MIRIKQILALILCLTVLGASAQSEIRLNSGKSGFTVLEKGPYKVKARVNFDKINTLNVNTVRGMFTQISIPGFGGSAVYGAPSLPVLARLIEIPYGAEAEVHIINYDVQEIRLNEAGIASRIIPAQPSLSKNQDPSSVPFHYNAADYQSDDFNATPLVSVTPSGTLRGVRLGKVFISPIRYNPVQNIVEVYTNLVFEIRFKHPDIALTEQMKARYYSPAFEPAFGQLINYSAPASKDVISKYPIKYVIISLSSFQSALQPFVRWKTKKGFTVIEQYYSSAPTTSTVKTYLQNLYNAGTSANPAPTYVLFVGDVAQIPTFTGIANTAHKTDLYYCTFDGSSDYIPDMYYGRFSATNTTHITNQVNKTLQYEQYTMPVKTYLDSVVMVAGNDDYGNDATYGNGQINYGTTNYFNAAHGINSYIILDPNNSESIAGANMRARLYKGVGYANYTAHCGSSGWSEPGFSTSQIANMYNANKYGLLVGNCCQSNTFNDTECFGEALLRAYPDKGAVGYIGGSNNSYWDEDYYWGVGARTSITVNPTYNASNLGAYDCMFHDHGEPKTSWFITNDQMIYAGNLAVEASTSTRNVYYWEIYHLMGDPSVMTYFSMPDPLTVNYTNPQSVGITSLVVNTEEDAYVAISLNGVLLDAEPAPAGGVVNLSFPAISLPDTADIVVTKQNKQPYIGTLIITQPSNPRDAEMVSIVKPEATYNCTGMNINPVVVIRNMGTVTMTSVRITYQVSGGSSQIYNWSGSLASMQSDTVTLPGTIAIAQGSHSFTATTSLPNGLADQNTANDSKSKDFSATSLPLSSNFSASATSFCAAPAQVQFTNNSTNATSYLWDFGDGSTSTDPNPTHSYTALGTYTVVLTGSAGICGTDSETKSGYIQVGASAPVTTGASRCGTGSVTLAASGSGTLNWFNASSGGTSINTGATYITPSLSSTTNYYVEQIVTPPSDYGGKTDTAGGAQLHTNNSYWLVFNCTTPVTLKSVKVYAGSAGNRTIEVRNSSGQALNPPLDTVINIPAGASRITLNFNIPAGTGLQLRCTSTNPNMYRNSGGISFPYNIAGKISITGSNATGSTRYYYFYDWELQSTPCSSARTPVTATILSSPAVAQFNYSLAGGTVNFTNTSTNGTSYYWSFGDGSTSTASNPSHTYTSNGTYSVMLVATNNCNSDTIRQDVTVLTVGMSENAAALIEVFPNPASDVINIKTGGAPVDKITISDLTGRELYETTHVLSITSIDISQFRTGVYMLTCHINGATLNYRISRIK